VRRQIEGSRGIAEAVALSRPQVVPAYPITPQTHIVEAVGVMVKDGTLAPCEFITVESEFGAMSAAIGASATGARTYTATSSQGLLYMAEALFNASGLGLPIVMTVANRAIGAPINIWNDHSDSMSQRDCGWVQLYAQDNQSAVGLHVIAFRLAEELSMPVMVCVDGFVLTHAFEPIDVPTQEQVDAFLPSYAPRQVLDPADPVTIGAMVGPEAFTEVRYLSHRHLTAALDVFPTVARSYADVVGADLPMIESYRTEGAGTVVVALGSVSGTVKDVIDESAGDVGLVTLTMFRPFPYAAVRSALSQARRVIVLERAFAPGARGIVASDVREALGGSPVEINTVVAGLGGRAISKASLHKLLADAAAGELGELTFLDLRHDLVERELARSQEQRESGPHTLNVLRDAGVPATRIS
jgi:pyruvate ferredoxin oxidoreductase alpha subunit